jgi:hypothetical protein
MMVSIEHWKFVRNELGISDERLAILVLTSLRGYQLPSLDDLRADRDSLRNLMRVLSGNTVPRERDED